MTNDDVQRWIDAYVAAWRTYDPDAIGALFSEEATYRYQAWRDPVVGRDAIVADWLDDQDEPGGWDAHYAPYAVEGDRAVATGETRYLERDGSLRTIYSNAWLLRFDADGRCSEFVEYWNEPPEAERAGR